ncbi:MAG: hypothetical protein M1822_007532 [Bathelium mastoideum]|nr:MAG: hypothetical protein M1822_007532 [Bathelium mastoideum]
MADTKQPNTGVRYPQLVSFVGETGAGKSTLIKMLVSLMEHKLSAYADLLFESPVVGSIKHDKSPTSGDVHLYADPETAYTRLPMLYADCEGLQGGEMEPAANKLRSKNKNSQGEWAVKRVYPRLLYTFSDVIVFVLRNTRTFESSTLTLLLDWASTSLEFSINQPTMPHAIIVLNATHPGVDNDEWDILTATERLMHHVANAVFENPFFVKYAEHWRKKGKRINNMLDLVRCYYADISVVRIPEKGRYMLTNSQINKLHHRIVLHCDASLSAKDDAHMLSNVEELDAYLQAGFDHFTTKEDQPFNFVDVALRNNPIPRDFGDHILALAAKIREVTHVRDGPHLFKILSSMVASCIFTDCIRASRPGKALDLFDKFYANSCVAALEHFCDKYWPCSFVSRKGKACVNVKSSHTSKGHQTARGKIISSGPYESAFSRFNFSDQWKFFLKNRLQEIEAEFQEKRNATMPKNDNPLTVNDRTLAYDLHKKCMARFFHSYEGYSASKFISLTTCYCCLMEVPEHPLQCGHVLCTRCVKAYGHQHDSHSMLMDYCPLHSTQRFDRPWIIHFKPDYAGVRILTLDGGGMRGILELEVLRAIELTLGGKIPIQAFFDLIVGTSTGGIVALGLGVKQWTVNQCVTEFVRLCDQAFTPREFKYVVGLEQATTLFHGSKYKTTPLREALHTAFGDESLYGGRRKAHLSYNTQVAVTATSGTGEMGLVLANYSRHEESEPSYKFEFPHHLQIWEAASATSAAPSFFKPFHVNRGYTWRTYLDGALYHNNPARVANHERKFLWPDVAGNPPDILLSLGTGKYGRQLEEQLAELDPLPGKQQPPRSSNPDMAAKSKKKHKRGKTSIIVAKLFSVLVNRIDNILDTELEWKRFCNDMSGTKQGQEQESRFVRVNLDLWREPPKMDEKHKLAQLQDVGTRLLKTDKYRSLIERIAHMLVASTFYFSKKRFWYNEHSGTWTCTGRIVCRFEGKLSESCNNMRALGDYLRHQQISGYQPFFTVKDDVDDPDRNQIPITESMIGGMANRAEFRFNDPINIDVPSQLSSTTIYLRMRGIHSEQTSYYPISGFPRSLIAEDMINGLSLPLSARQHLLNKESETRLDKRAELIKERRYGGLVVASDPKVAQPRSGDHVPEMTTEETQDAADEDGEESTPVRAEGPGNTDTATTTTAATRRASNSQASSQTLYSQQSGGSSSSAPKTVRQRVSIADIRAQAQDSPGSPIIIKDDEQLARNLSTFSLGSNRIGLNGGASDLDSDDSDGPPSEWEDQEME